MAGIIAALAQLTLDRLEVKGKDPGAVSFSDLGEAMGEACEEMKALLRRHGFDVDQANVKGNH